MTNPERTSRSRVEAPRDEEQPRPEPRSPRRRRSHFELQICHWVVRQIDLLSKGGTDMGNIVHRCDDALEMLGFSVLRLRSAEDARAFIERCRAGLPRMPKLRKGRPFDTLERFGRLFGLDAIEREIIAYEIAVCQTVALAQLWDLHSCRSERVFVELLAKTLGLPTKEVASRFANDAPLIATGLISPFDSGRDLRSRRRRDTGGSLRDGLADVLEREYATDDALLAEFFTVAPKTDLTLADFGHLGPPVEDLRRLLLGARRGKAAGVNVLLYGLPGTGKTALVRALAAAIDEPLYEITGAGQGEDPFERNERLSTYLLCQRILKRIDRGIVVFDEAEDLFPFEAWEGMGLHRQSGRKKALTNAMLEKNPAPTVWVSNRVRHFDPAFLRRFDLCLQLPLPPPELRRAVLLKQLKDCAVAGEWLERTAECPSITAADITSATRTLQLCAVSDPTEAEQMLDRVLSGKLEARGEQLGKGTLAPPSDGYDLGVLNTSRDVEALASALEASRSGAILLYGPPGTGKTAYCRHLAKRLGRPLLERRASDLLSRWVGDSERNIAAMFREAQASDSLLLLDEADGLLRERAKAYQSWQVTQVNELLVGMEQFPGIFLCATNLVEDLDHASIRRFTMEVQFDYLKPAQTWALFKLTARGLGLEIDSDRTATETRQTENALRALPNLAPGDFAKMRRRVRLLRGEVTVERLVSELAAEARAKNLTQGMQRAVGFR